MINFVKNKLFFIKKLVKFKDYQYHILLTAIAALMVYFIIKGLQSFIFFVVLERIYISLNGSLWILSGSILLCLSLMFYKVCPFSVPHKYCLAGIALLSILTILNGFFCYSELYSRGVGHSGFFVKQGLLDTGTFLEFKNVTSSTMFFSKERFRGKKAADLFHKNYDLIFRNGKTLKYIDDNNLVEQALAEYKVTITIIPNGYEYEEEKFKNEIKKAERIYTSPEYIPCW